MIFVRNLYITISILLVYNLVLVLIERVEDENDAVKFRRDFLLSFVAYSFGYRKETSWQQKGRS